MSSPIRCLQSFICGVCLFSLRLFLSSTTRLIDDSKCSLGRSSPCFSPVMNRLQVQGLTHVHLDVAGIGSITLRKGEAVTEKRWMNYFLDFMVAFLYWHQQVSDSAISNTVPRLLPKMCFSHCVNVWQTSFSSKQMHLINHKLNLWWCQFPLKGAGEVLLCHRQSDG